MAELAAENVIAGLHGLPLPSCINPTVERHFGAATG
jgi:hypothetical protein